jgi:hypothetical protein
MDEQPLQYSPHAREKMAAYRITEDEVEAIVWYPAWRRQSHHRRIEHYGYSDDGRLLRVVTDEHEERVITVVDRWRRKRQNKR